MRFYINTREAKTEPAHIHVCLGRNKRDTDLKVWLSDPIDIADEVGKWPPDKKKWALKIIRQNREEFIADYEKLHGKFVREIG